MTYNYVWSLMHIYVEKLHEMRWRAISLLSHCARIAFTLSLGICHAIEAFSISVRRLKRWWPLLHHLTTSHLRSHLHRCFRRIRLSLAAAHLPAARSWCVSGALNSPCSAFLHCKISHYDYHRFIRPTLSLSIRNSCSRCLLAHPFNFVLERTGERAAQRASEGRGGKKVTKKTAKSNERVNEHNNNKMIFRRAEENIPFHWLFSAARTPFSTREYSICFVFNLAIPSM